MRAKIVNQSSDFPVRRTGSYRHKKTLIIGHMGTGFYGSNDPTNSVKALKEHIERNQFKQITTIHLNLAH